MERFPVTGVIPPELDTEGEEPLGFSIDVQKTSPFEKTLHLVPKAVVLGIGCKRGTERAVIQELVEEVLEVNGIFRESICKIASIDLKKDRNRDSGVGRKLSGSLSHLSRRGAEKSSV